MRTKITTGLIATNADGRPSVRPPMPASWCRPTVIPEAGSELDGVTGVGRSEETSQAVVPSNMSSECIPSTGEGEQRLNDGGYDVNIPHDSHTNNVTESSNGDENTPGYETTNEIENPSPPQYDPSLPPPRANLNSNPSVLDKENAASSKSSTPLVPHELSDEVGADISVEDVGDVDREIDVECNPGSQSSVRPYVQQSLDVGVLEPKTVPRGDQASCSHLSDEMDRQGVSNSTHQITVNANSGEQLDAVSMTIASVAAGEGEPPAFLLMDHSREDGYSSMPQDIPPGKHKKVKGQKGNASASARLPVISSLLAPSGANSSKTGEMSSHTSPLPGIQHIASGNANSSSPTTVLPSVAHFLGPAKSPPTAYTPHQASPDLYRQSLSTPSVGTEANRPGSSKSKNNRKAVTPAGLRLSMAASEELPDPLPLPQYSDKVLRAKQMGTIAFDRPTVLRETVQFFLQFKHYWSSHDYDRISNLVVELFPEFKDSETPGVPVNKRIRTDLSMYARNFRRREVSQRKKDGSGGPSGIEGAREPRADGGSPSDGVKSFLHSPPPSAAPMSSNNPTNFCNELLTAASIIESQTSSAAGKNDEMRNQTHSAHPPSNSHSAKAAKVPAQAAKHDNMGEAVHGQGMEDDDDDTPIHFMYDREAMTAAAGRDATTAWQLYSDQVAQAMSAGGNVSQDYGLPEEVAGGANSDRLSAMAMWRSTALPDPLPVPPYSDGVLRARETGNTTSARPKIIRETTQFFLALKLWWTAPDYERIAELVLQNFPALISLQAIKKDLGTCARNMRRRLPSGRHKASSSPSKHATEQTMPQTAATPSTSTAAASQASAEYMKALMAAQNMNMTELGMTQRNLGELAVLAGIKQRMEQRPQDVTDLERQYLAQCGSEEQRQALMASGAFGNDTAAMAALSAFYGQLGMDISGTGNKRGEYSVSAHEGTAPSGMEAASQSKRQRRISQAEVERRLKEAELSSSNNSLESSKVIHHSHIGGVTVSDKALVKREPMSPSGVEGLKSAAVPASMKEQQEHHQQQQQQPPQGSSQQAHIGMYPSTTQDQVYWEAQAIANMALLNHPSSSSTTFPSATQAHSQPHIQHLPVHETGASNFSGADTPMNLTYDADKHSSIPRAMPSPMAQDTLPDTAGLAAQVEVTTSSNSKSHSSPRRRTSSSPRSGDTAAAAREQVWFPHGAGFKKENQEVVCLPDPLPIPDYSPKILTAREEGTVSKHRSEIIRETARFFLGLKYWWSSADYTRISELVVQHFPGLRDDNTPEGMSTFRRIQRDLSMCARNLRRSKKPRRDRDGSSHSTSHDPMSGIAHPPPKKSKLSKQSGEKKLKKLGKKKSKASVPAAAVVSEPAAMTSVNEDMTAAAALLQQQYMQSSSPYHPSAHLLPSSHLLPSLQTHPALHEQQMQLNSTLLQQQQQQQQQPQHHQHPQIGIDESGKGLVKEEPGPNSMEHVEQEPSPGMKSNPMTPMQKTPTPTLESVHSEAQEVARALARAAPSRGELEVQAEKLEQEKISQQQQAVAQNSMKVYQDPDHGNDLQERFAGLWRKGKFFDASLGVANKKLHVHKLVLLAMSPYLQETFKNADPRSQLEVNLPSDTTYETAKAFLKYIYEGILEVDTSSVRSLHKIATMLQMSKLAQYCQNFAQQLHDAAENANSAVQGEIPKISVNLGDLAELQAAQRQKLLEAQALQRLGDTNTINSTDLHQRTNASRYHVADEHAQLKAEYLASHHQGSNEASLANTPNFLNQEALAQHRALIAATASVQSSTSDLPPSSLLLTSSHDPATQQLLHATLARNSSSTSASASQYHHHHSQQQQQQQSQMAVQNDNSALLHRLTSESSTSGSNNSLDQQQRLALAYWQAHTFGEIVPRNQVDPNTLSSAELASVASADDQRHMLSSLGHEVKLKADRDRHSKEWVGEADGVHQATMLPETCLPVDMARSHQVANAEGT